MESNRVAFLIVGSFLDYPGSRGQRSQNLEGDWTKKKNPVGLLHRASHFSCVVSAQVLPVAMAMHSVYSQNPELFILQIFKMFLWLASLALSAAP